MQVAKNLGLLLLALCYFVVALAVGAAIIALSAYFGLGAEVFNNHLGKIGTSPFYKYSIGLIFYAFVLLIIYFFPHWLFKKYNRQDFVPLTAFTFTRLFWHVIGIIFLMIVFLIIIANFAPQWLPNVAF